MRRQTAGLAILALLFASLSFAQTAPLTSGTGVPPVIRFSGTLAVPPGRVPVTFGLYADQTGGEPLWQEMQTVPVDAAGRYAVTLGALAPEGLPLALFTSGEARWLGVAADGGAELPRIALLSVPYALKAADTETVAGKPLSAFVLAGDTTGTGDDGLTYVNTRLLQGAVLGVTPMASSGSPGYLGMFTNPTDLGNSIMFQSGTSIGVNTPAPLDAMHVRFTNTGGQMTGFAVQNLGSTATSYSGMLFYDQNGALGQFQGFNNATHEYRINNIASNGSINFMIGSSSKFYVANSGNIGLGTTTPAQKLSVAGTVESTTGGFRFPDGTTQATAGTIGGVTGLTAGAGISVTGSAPSPTVSIATAGIVNAMIGSLAVANANIANVSASKITGSLPVAQVAGAATLGANTFVGTQTISGGSGTGVYGASTTGTGVEGSTASITSYAGYFYNGGGSGTSRGVGVAAFTGNGSSSDTHPGGMYYKAAGEFSGPVGIIGATSPESTSGDAIHAVAGSASGLWALRATKSGGGDYAGYFAGNVYVLGNLSASGTKPFKIDHPLDPANQYLYHYAVESPEVQNMYNGTIRLDATGAAVVTLPDYFSAINTGDYCYSVTPIGAPMPNLYIAEEIKGNTFTIAGGVAGQKVSWLVYAQRSDAWLRDHPASDVVDKPPEERGTYVYPQAYGLPESRSLTSAHDQVLNHTPPLVSPLTSTLPIMPTTSLPPAAVPGRLPSGGGAGGVR